MADDKGMKSAYELAMERLRKNDEEAGVERRPVTDAQKAAIAEIRNFYEAKIAEVEVLHQGRLRTTMDPAERAAREDDVPPRPPAALDRAGRENREGPSRRGVVDELSRRRHE